jgi:hypothetical protein
MSMIQDLQCPNCGAALDASTKSDNIIRCDFCGTDNALNRRDPLSAVDNPHALAVKLRKILATHFSLEELKTLVFELSGALPEPYRLDFDDLPGQGRRGKTLELVMWCERRMVLAELANTIHSLRPEIDLP